MSRYTKLMNAVRKIPVDKPYRVETYIPAYIRRRINRGLDRSLWFRIYLPEDRTLEGSGHGICDLYLLDYPLQKWIIAADSFLTSEGIKTITTFGQTNYHLNVHFGWMRAS